MIVMAEKLTGRFNVYRDDNVGGAGAALRNVGDLLGNKLTREEFDGITNHIVSSGANDGIPAARKAFNKGYLEMLETLAEI